MNKPTLKYFLRDEKAMAPSKRAEDSGYDLYAIIDDDYLILEPGESKLFKTGLSVALPAGWGFFICNRGGIGSKNLVYGAHVVDSGYRGEVFIDLHNIGDTPIIITAPPKKDATKEEIQAYLINMFIEEFNGNERKLSRQELFELIMAIRSDEYRFIDKNKAIAQGVILQTPDCDTEEVFTLEALGESLRGSGALGSSGK